MFAVSHYKFTGFKSMVYHGFGMALFIAIKNGFVRSLKIIRRKVTNENLLN